MRPQLQNFRNDNFSKLFCLLCVFVLLPFTSACTGMGGPQADSVTDTKTEKKKKGITVWFCKANDDDIELVPVVRSKTGTDDLHSAIDQLLMGPDNSEAENGLSSEIPKGTILLDIKEDGENIELNLSKRFSSGGGPLSIETRLKQLSKTVGTVVGDSKVYLNIEGTRLSAVGADGLEVTQPIN